MRIVDFPRPGLHWLLLALLFLAPQLAGAQLCDADLTATGGGFYRVWTAGVETSVHVRLDQAVLRAMVQESADPTQTVVITHDYHLRVECPAQPAPPTTDVLHWYRYGVTVDGDEMRWTERRHDADGTPSDSTTIMTTPLMGVVLYSGELAIGCVGDCGHPGATGLPLLTHAIATRYFPR